MVKVIYLLAYLLSVLLNIISAYDSEVYAEKGCPSIIHRSEWGARTPQSINYITKPLKYVIVHHTVTPQCKDQSNCTSIVKSIQDFHLENLEFPDIGYNFIIGCDRNVYEGAGWHKMGAHTYGYNSRSLGLAFIGDFSDKKPCDIQLDTAKRFLDCAVKLGELDDRYKVLGARQVTSTQSPGVRLYSEIKKWIHFSVNP